MSQYHLSSPIVSDCVKLLIWMGVVGKDDTHIITCNARQIAHSRRQCPHHEHPGIPRGVDPEYNVSVWRMYICIRLLKNNQDVGDVLVADHPERQHAAGNLTRCILPACPCMPPVSGIGSSPTIVCDDTRPIISMTLLLYQYQVRCVLPSG